MSRKFAVVSIGTNSTRLLIVRRASDGRLEPTIQRSIGTRLGANLRDTGTLDAEGFARTLKVIDEYVEVVRREKADVSAIATSAVRRASDGPAFAREVEERLGVPLDVLTGMREAELSFLGATSAHGRTHERAGVLDVGGGSTEYACGQSVIEARASCELGAVRLSEELPECLGAIACDPVALERRARDRAVEALAPLEGMPEVDRVYAVGGTAFNAASIVGEAERGSVDGTILSRASLQSLARRFLSMPIEHRRTEPRISAQRADIFPAGLLIIDEALRILGVDACVVSRADLLYGYLLERHVESAGT